MRVMSSRGPCASGGTDSLRVMIRWPRRRGESDY